MFNTACTQDPRRLKFIWSIAIDSAKKFCTRAQIWSLFFSPTTRNPFQRRTSIHLHIDFIQTQRFNIACLKFNEGRILITLGSTGFYIDFMLTTSLHRRSTLEWLAIPGLHRWRLSGKAGAEPQSGSWMWEISEFRRFFVRFVFCFPPLFCMTSEMIQANNVSELPWILGFYRSCVCVGMSSCFEIEVHETCNSLNIIVNICKHNKGYLTGVQLSLF